jgi:Flp pilus assembly protein TadD
MPDSWAAHLGHGITFLQMGRSEDAVRSMEKAARLSERLPLALGYLGSAYAQAGRVAQARKILEELQELSHHRSVPQTVFAMIHVTLGDLEDGFECLEKAVDAHEGTFFIQYSNAFPFDSLVSHPRYHALLRKMNLEA